MSLLQLDSHDVLQSGEWIGGRGQHPAGRLLPLNLEEGTEGGREGGKEREELWDGS